MLDDLGFRSLFDALGDATPETDVVRSILEPATDETRALVETCAHAFRADASEIRDRDLIELSWELYALSRVTDRLIGFVGTGALGSDDYARFMVALGFRRSFESSFHPFWHEIVQVEQAARADAPPTILEEIWPAFFVEHLLIARAGVRVQSGAAFLRAGIADRSTLYFTHARPWRRAADLSHGWGSNSQWRTAFRRDYVLDDSYVFNAGADDSGRPAEELEPAEQLELVRPRCFVVTEKPHDDLWPYDLRYVKRR